MNLRNNSLGTPDLHLFGSLINRTNYSDARASWYAANVESGSCHWTTVGTSLEHLTTCAIVFVAVGTLRASIAFFISEGLEEHVPRFMLFPYLEGIVSIVMNLGYVDAALNVLVVSHTCPAIIFVGCVLCFMPIAATTFALVWIRMHLNDGNISWTRFTQPGLAELKGRLADAGKSILDKYFALKLWREERACKGEWNKNTDQAQFWQFFIEEFRLQEVCP